jgi:hypothetical protein
MAVSSCPRWRFLIVVEQKVLRTAIEKEMDVRFADPEMEQLRAAGLRKQIERRSSMEIGWSR